MSKEQEIKVGGHHKAVKMGLGDAIQRLMKVEHLYASGVASIPSKMLEERDLIIAALNDQFELNLGFDCNNDNVPDTVAIFQQTAQTSCCRILPSEIQKQVQKRSSRSVPVDEAQKKRPEEEVAAPARQHSGIKKFSEPVRKMTESDPVIARIRKGFRKTTPMPDPTPA